ncbi:MAG TPA: hypothetical protein ENG60_03200 [Thermoplasmatales archaeon]|nr:hypothetical protein [Thermoplasmatales archaeon]HEX17398.1 hypothetical protein [Thermoplasmatales archaeon]
MPPTVTRERLILIIDIIMFIIAIISMVLTALNFYMAGYASGGGDYIGAQNHLMHACASTAFLAVSMMWIFVRFSRNWGKRII